jgi:hypothetical protein
MFASLRDPWRRAWAEPTLRVHLIATPVVLLVVLRTMAWFLVWVEHRPGARLADPLLVLLTPHDATWVVFGLLYVAILLALFDTSRDPRRLVIGVQAYTLMILARLVAMYVTPLDPPTDMIALRDPFVETAASGTLLTRDLFFSGHTSTSFLMFLVVKNRRLQPVLLACAAGVAAGVLWQHVHYTVDVLVAPLFAFGSLRAVQGAHQAWPWKRGAR